MDLRPFSGKEAKAPPTEVQRGLVRETLPWRLVGLVDELHRCALVDAVVDLVPKVASSDLLETIAVPTTSAR